MSNFLRSSARAAARRPTAPRRAYGSVARATGSGMTAGTRRTSLFGAPSASWAAAEAAPGMALRQRTAVYAAAPAAQQAAPGAEPRHRYSTALLRTAMAAQQPAAAAASDAGASAGASGSSSSADPRFPPVLRVKVNQMNSFTWAWQTMLELVVVFMFLHSVVIPIITFMIEKPIEALLWLASDPAQE